MTANEKAPRSTSRMLTTSQAMLPTPATSTAEVSTRHLSCVETGRARPSRAFVLHVAEHLDVPLRARNELLLALRLGAAALADPALVALHDELARLPGLVREMPVTEHPGVVLPVRPRTPYGVLSFFTTIARFGTAADVTLAELSIESFFPADAATGRTVRELTG